MRKIMECGGWKSDVTLSKYYLRTPATGTAVGKTSPDTPEVAIASTMADREDTTEDTTEEDTLMEVKRPSE